MREKIRLIVIKWARSYSTYKYKKQIFPARVGLILTHVYTQKSSDCYVTLFCENCRNVCFLMPTFNWQPSFGPFTVQCLLPIISGPKHVLCKTKTIVCLLSLCRPHLDLDLDHYLDLTFSVIFKMIPYPNFNRHQNNIFFIIYTYTHLNKYLICVVSLSRHNWTHIPRAPHLDFYI